VLTASVVSLGACGASQPDPAHTHNDPAGQNHAAAKTSGQDPSYLKYEQNTIDIAHKYRESVVAINVTVKGKAVNPLQNMPPQMRQFFKQFMPQNQQHGGESHPIERAAGSGFVVDKKGQIVTNFHVVKSALKNGKAELKDSAKVNVQFPGKEEKLPVKVVGVDESYDLALFQLKDPDKLPKKTIPMPLADSSKVKVGEKAIAIGNPFTLESTVTQGIVSAINRRQAALVSGVPIPYIQTDASINPGNSGGPLVNSQGEVIGINDEILAPRGTSVGVGFAIPSNLLKQNLKQLKGGGYIKKAQMGIEIVSLDHYPKSVRQYLHLPDHGVMVVKVAKDSPAEKAGLQGAQIAVSKGGRQWPAGGDIILKANGKKLNSAKELQNVVYSEQEGDKVKLTILRDDKKQEVTVKLAVLKNSIR
jgi:S1-C subfamily serine protease